MKLVLKQTLTEIMLMKNNQDNKGPQCKYLKKSTEQLKKLTEQSFKKSLVY